LATLNRRGSTWQLNWSDATGQRRVSLGAISRQEAEIKRKEKELELATGRRYGVSGVLFDAFAAEYLAWYEHQYPSTFERTAGIFRRSLLPRFESLELDTLKPSDVTNWLIWRKGAKPTPAPATLTKEARALHAMLRKAVDWRAIQNNPLVGVRPPPERASRSPEYYSAQQLLELYKGSPNHQHIWRLLANTGLRRNEALNLRMSDVKGDVLHVESREETPTKSRRWRSVPLNEAASKAILALGPREREWVLPRVNPRSLSRAFDKCASRARLKGSLHTLRHTFISHLVMAGVDLATVQKIAGHATITTTMRYAHLSGDHAQRAVAKIAL
jgi:integrase